MRFPGFRAQTDKYQELKVTMSYYLKKYYRVREVEPAYQGTLVNQDLEEILDCYVLQKPLTLLHFDAIRETLFLDMLNALRPFFFIGVRKMKQPASGHITAFLYISRFRNLLEVASSIPFNDKYADILGMLVGYTPGPISEYYNRWGTGLVKE